MDPKGTYRNTNNDMRSAFYACKILDRERGKREREADSVREREAGSVRERGRQC